MPITLGRFGRPKLTPLQTESEKIFPEKMILQGNFVSTANPSEASEQCNKISLVLDWLFICMTEGHIEPSQPRIGRLCGWPQRQFLCESLYIDFECWCIKKDLLSRERASGKMFYSIVDKIFARQREKYDFPPLDECRSKFNALAKILKK